MKEFFKNLKNNLTYDYKGELAYVKGLLIFKDKQIKNREELLFAKKDELKAKLEECVALNSRIEELNQDNEQKADIIRDLKRDGHKQIEEYVALKNELVGVNATITICETEIKELNKTITNLKKSIGSYQGKFKRIKEENVNLKKEYTENIKIIQELREELETRPKEIIKCEEPKTKKRRGKKVCK